MDAQTEPLKDVLDRITAKQNSLSERDPIPYLNSQILCLGLYNALVEIINKGQKEGMDYPTHVKAYAEVVEAILDTVNDSSGPETCVYLKLAELRRIVEERKSGGINEVTQPGSPERKKD